MLATSATAPRLRYPFGLRSTAPVERALLAIVTLAALTGIVIELSHGLGAGVIPPLLAAVGAGVAWRRRAIGAAVLLASALLAGVLHAGVVVTWTILAMGVLLITLRGGRARYLAPLAGACAFVSEALVSAQGPLAPPAFAALGVTVAGAATGSAIREHFRFLDALAASARDAVRTRELEGAARLTEERLRIARDLHDLVGHQVAVVNMHISMAEVALPGGSVESRRSLAEARVGVRSILQESQRILDVLRRGGGSADDANAPVPSIDRIGDLIATYRTIGLEVESSIDDVPTSVDDGVGATAYRVLQEALTNAHRHGSGRVRVELAAEGAELTVRVENAVVPGGSGTDEGSGYGLIGLRERLASVGGTLRVEQDGKRFAIEARLRMDGRAVA